MAWLLPLMNFVFYLVAFLVLISIITVVHEFGHYIVAKRSGIKVEEFSLGFGPILFSRPDKDGTLWKICAIPCGGYVKMFGDAGPDSTPDPERLAQMSPEDKKQSFYFQSPWKKIPVILAGPAMNFLLCIFILWIVIMCKGIDVPQDTVVDSLMLGSPAQTAGVLPGDRVVSVNGKATKKFTEMQEIISSSRDDELVLRVQRDGRLKYIIVRPTLLSSCDPVSGQTINKRAVGIIAGISKHVRVNPLTAFGLAIYETYGTSKAILRVLGRLITGKQSMNELGGPVRIAQESGKVAKAGFFMFLWFIALISVNVGLVNLLPIPALDGGHFVFYLIEGVTRKEIPLKFKERIGMVCFALLLLLIVLITLNDVRQLIIH